MQLAFQEIVLEIPCPGKTNIATGTKKSLANQLKRNRFTLNNSSECPKPGNDPLSPGLHLTERVGSLTTH